MRRHLGALLLGATIVVTIAGLAETLYELETGQPYLLIDELTVREQRTRSRRRNEPEIETQLDVSLELSGYLQAEPT